MLNFANHYLIIDHELLLKIRPNGLDVANLFAFGWIGCFHCDTISHWKLSKSEIRLTQVEPSEVKWVMKYFICKTFLSCAQKRFSWSICRLGIFCQLNYLSKLDLRTNMSSNRDTVMSFIQSKLVGWGI